MRSLSNAKLYSKLKNSLKFELIAPNKFEVFLSIVLELEICFSFLSLKTVANLLKFVNIFISSLKSRPILMISLSNVSVNPSLFIPNILLSIYYLLNWSYHSC